MVTNLACGRVVRQQCASDEIHSVRTRLLFFRGCPINIYTPRVLKALFEAKAHGSTSIRFMSWLCFINKTTRYSYHFVQRFSLFHHFSAVALEEEAVTSGGFFAFEPGTSSVDSALMMDDFPVTNEFRLKRTRI